jgi:hypothetical protein
MTIDGADTTERTTVVLSVREPGDSARVKFIAFDAEERALRPEWVRLTSAYSDSLGEFKRAYYTFLSMTPAERESHDSATAGTLLRELLSRNTHSDFNAALSTLMTSPSAPDRAVAALLLTHFPEREDTWHTLLQGSMAQHQWLDASIAAEALAWLGRYRPIDLSWDPVAAEINSALDGTALPAFRAIGYALLTTRAANRGNANAFLKGGGEMLTAYLESSVLEYSRLAHELLKGLRGADLGTSPGPWRSWIAGM